MNPDASVKALASIEVDLSAIETGQSITVTWRGKPVFIRRRTQGEIAEARTVADTDLPDPQNDAERVQKDEWLVMVGICTHLGCVPLGQAGDFNGWFCPCHGSHYDTSGRIRKGPAPKNLEIPSYEFVGDSRIKIG
jgi:ubiquinol-cytochrome c reductase iron-sulfur subunit